jgi:hypothetical protein
VPIEGTFWESKSHRISLWQILEKCEVRELQQVVFVQLGTLLGDITSLSQGSDVILTQFLDWLPRQEGETIETFLRGLHDLKPNVGAHALLEVLCKSPLANPALAVPSARVPSPAPTSSDGGTRSSVAGSASSSELALEPAPWEDEYMPCEQAFAGRDSIRTAVKELQTDSALRILRADGPKGVGKSHCHYYMRARLRRSSDNARLSYICFDNKTPDVVYGGPNYRLVNRIIGDWEFPTRDLLGEETRDHPVEKIFHELETRIESQASSIGQLWIVFDQFPRDHVAGHEAGNDTDAFIRYIANAAGYHRGNLRLVLLGYKREYLTGGAELQVGLDFLKQDELEKYFEILQRNIGCQTPREVEEFLRDYRADTPRSTHCRKLLQKIPAIIARMRNMRIR